MAPTPRSLVSALPFLGMMAAAMGPGASAAAGQYFGRNHIRYESFRFDVLKTEHFDIYHYAEEAEAVALVGRMAERWYTRLTRLLGDSLVGRQPIILYASAPHFRQTTVVEGIGEGTGGVTEAFKRRVVLPLAGPLAETDHVLGHELVHAFQYDLSSRGRPGLAQPGVTALPLWLVEGMAEYLSVGPVDPHTAMWMRDAARSDRLPTLFQLNDPRYFPYRYGQAVWAYFAGRWGDGVPGRVLTAGGEGGGSFELGQLLGESVDSVSSRWHRAIRETYLTVERDTRDASDYGRRAVRDSTPRGEQLNLAPALSPDGRRLVFLSERDRDAVDMFLADVETGHIIRKITRSAIDPHFESLQFIASAGAWHPDGRRFAFAGVAKGRAVISVMDTERGKIVREFELKEVDEAFNPTWSPDGVRLAFSATSGGFSDIFLLDTRTGEVSRLTHDPYAELHPAWSPDGRYIAVSTDRFTSDLEALSFGDYRLALIDAQTGAIRELPSFDDAKHINPQWSPDGQSLFFLSDRAGITNLYRLELASGEVRQITNLFTGVSGITALSPALSVAASVPRVAFSAYESGRHRIYVVDSVAVLAGEPPAPPFVGVDPAALPPLLARKDTLLTALLHSPRVGLPAADSIPPTVAYRSGLSLDYFLPVSLSVGSASAFGGFVGGGSAMFFSDMLGRRRLAAVLQVSGSFDDFAALASYRDLSRRWTWGFVIGQTPFTSLGFRRTRIGTDSVIVDSLFRFRQTDRQVTAVLAYPFSRAQRLEFTGGYRTSGFTREVVTRSVTLRPPQPARVTDPVDLGAPSSIDQTEGGAALVYDNTQFGATGPVRGQRYRMGAAVSEGTLKYYTLSLDYRRYLMPRRPYTIAFRFLHYGRYGRDADDVRQNPLFIGYQTLVRGYESNSFDLRGCPVFIRQPGDCPVPGFDALVGSRMMVGNLELRVPLAQILGPSAALLPIPIEVAPFVDAGVAWTGTADPIFLRGSRRPVTSYGVTLRANLFGFAVIQADMVHPNDRPDRRWRWVVGFAPGF